MGFKSPMATQIYDGLHFALGFSHTIHGFQVHNGFSHTIYGFQLMNGFANFHGFHYGLASHTSYLVSFSFWAHSHLNSGLQIRDGCAYSDLVSNSLWLRKPILDFIPYVASQSNVGFHLLSGFAYLLWGFVPIK